MGRRPCGAKGVIRGAWCAWEDDILKNYIEIHGKGKWTDLPQRAVVLFCRLYIYTDISYFAMWEELPASLVELSKARYQERQLF
ncbi:anthocyanin regulatory c1 protein [Quercus suber]|uniref:Anthocyanin regulatory c1 protein n=1 Tax=Quercus suber TaxID=58331 RepID=A0AAW0J8G1_QUESU